VGFFWVGNNNGKLYQGVLGAIKINYDVQIYEN